MKCCHGYRRIAGALQGVPFKINYFPADIQKAGKVTLLGANACYSLVQNILFCRILEINIYKITISHQFVVIFIMKSCSLVR
jgi:hypothetical protein